MLDGHRMQQLFVKGEVIACAHSIEGYQCLVIITNDGWFVCKHGFFAKDKEDLEKKFFAYLETDDFQNRLYQR